VIAVLATAVARTAALPAGIAGGWGFARPLGLAALGLALLVVLASLLRRDASRQEPRPLGTARFLDDAEGESERGARLRLPPSRLLAIAAIVLGAVALAGPVPPEPEDPPVRLVALVDRSPSMHLPIDAGEPDGPTRLEAAASALTAAAAGEWAGALGRDVGVAWRDADGGAAPIESAELPAALAAPPRVPAGEPRWAALDWPGVVWVTDRAPDRAPTFAGLAASGGEPVPGPVGWSRAGPLVETVDGAVEVRPGAAPPPTARLEADVDAAVAGVVRAWAGDRGVALGADAGGAALVVDAAGAGPPGAGAPATVAGGGWSAPADGVGAAAPWSVSPGRVALGFRALRGDPSDPIAFASELADALDAALVLPPAYVPREERVDAGAPSLAPPPAPLEAEAAAARRAARTARARRARIAEGGLALAAAALALAAGLLRRSGR